MKSENDIGVKPPGKKLLRRITYMFVGIMLLLTFFSSTINNMGLIRVIAADVKAGRLTYRLTGSAVATPANIKYIYPLYSFTLESIDVKVGDVVVKGQTLAAFNVKELEDELKSKVRELESSKAEMRTESMDYNFDIKDAESKAASARNELAVSSELFRSGAETSVNVEKLKEESDAADRELEKLRDEKAAALVDLQREADELEQDIDSLKSDIDSHKALLSPADGYIWEINAQAGSVPDNSKPMIRIAGYGSSYRAEFSVDASEGKNLKAGDKMIINIPSMDGKKIEAQVGSARLERTASGAEVTVSAEFDGTGLKGGEMLEIEITKESRFSDTIIPNSAVRKDASGRNYVYVIKERKSSLGREYYLQKAFIYIEASDKNETAVASGLSLFESVVAESDRPVMEGDRVKIKKE